MTITVEANHIYNEPVEIVAATHLSKYPNKYDPDVLACKTIERKVSKTCSFTKRIAICKNILPNFLKRVSWILLL